MALDKIGHLPRRERTGSKKKKVKKPPKAKNLAKEQAKEVLHQIKAREYGNKKHSHNIDLWQLLKEDEDLTPETKAHYE